MDQQLQQLHRSLSITIWIGIVANMSFVLGLCFAPDFFLGLLQIPLEPKIWARAAGMLLFIISVFYVPATWDADRYRANAWFHCIPSRLCGSTFFTVAVLAFGFPIGYLSIAVVDAVFLVLVLRLLLKITSLEKKEGRSVSLR